MRYLLQYENYSELNVRRKYLEDTFHLWFILSKSIDGFFVLESFPNTTENDICLIYGHNYNILGLLHKHQEELYEKNIYIISCRTKNLHNFLVPNKNVYLAPQIGNRLPLRDGLAYGFDFDISDVELNLYNSSNTNTTNKLNNTFIKII